MIHTYNNLFYIYRKCVGNLWRIQVFFCEYFGRYLWVFYHMSIGNLGKLQSSFPIFPSLPTSPATASSLVVNCQLIEREWSLANSNYFRFYYEKLNCFLNYKINWDCFNFSNSYFLALVLLFIGKLCIQPPRCKKPLQTQMRENLYFPRLWRCWRLGTGRPRPRGSSRRRSI